MAEERQRVGFVGVGTIGKPMALNVLKGGYPLTVFDLNQAAVGEMIAAGAKGAPTPAEVARQSDVVITMVPDAPDVEKAALGPGGVIEGLACSWGCTWSVAWLWLWSCSVPSAWRCLCVWGRLRNARRMPQTV